VTAFSASAKMKPPSAPLQAFDATCSARLDCRVDTIPFGLHRLLSDFRLLELLLFDGRTKGRYSIALPSTGFGRDCRTGSRFGLCQPSRCAAPPKLGRPR